MTIQEQTPPPAEPTNIGGLKVWNELEKIPGTTVIPIRDILEALDTLDSEPEGFTGLDLGSGEGRTTQVLKEVFTEEKGNKIVALDLSFAGLQKTNSDLRVQAKAEELPMSEEAFDFVNVCGVLTNLVHDDPEKAVELRKQVFRQLFRVLKEEGVLAISDFGAEHVSDDYPVSYERHALITNENGTIAVLKSGENFVGKSDDEVAAMRGTEAIERFAHHYTRKELIELAEEAGFNIDNVRLDNTLTPNGKRKIENVILIAKKPAQIVEEDN